VAQGSIKKRLLDGGRVRWDVVVDLGNDPVTGKRRQRKKTFTTKKEAQAALTNWQADIDKGVAVDRSPLTVGKYMAHWLGALAAHRVRATTLESYEDKTRLYILPSSGQTPLQKLTPAMLQALYARLLAGEGAQRSLSPRTVRYTHAILRMALKEAERVGLVARNAADRVSPPRDRRPPIETWDTAEVRRFLAVAEDDGYSPVWLLALHTGMRRGELLGLRWTDVDLAKGVLHVRQSVTVLHHAPYVGEPKTASGRRTIALDAPSVAALREHRVRQNARRLALGAAWQDYDLVFASAVGTPIDSNTLSRRFVALVAKAGVPRVPFHGLRHTHATLLMKQGVHPKVASERLGHADINIALQTYSHVLPAMQREATDIFAAAIAEGQ
jgi:integrase